MNCIFAAMGFITPSSLTVLELPRCGVFQYAGILLREKILMGEHNRLMTITAIVALGVNGFIFPLNVYGTAIDVNADHHDLVSLTHSASATAAIMATEAVENPEDKIVIIVSSGSNFPY